MSAKQPTSTSITPSTGMMIRPKIQFLARSDLLVWGQRGVILAHLEGDAHKAEQGKRHDDVAEDLQGDHAAIDGAAGGGGQRLLVAASLGHQEREVGQVVALAHRLTLVAGFGDNLFEWGKSDNQNISHNRGNLQLSFKAYDLFLAKITNGICQPPTLIIIIRLWKHAICT